MRVHSRECYSGGMKREWVSWSVELRVGASLSESDGISAGYPGWMDSSLSDISVAIDGKNDSGKKAWLLQKDSISENEIAREKRHIEQAIDSFLQNMQIAVSAHSTRGEGRWSKREESS